MCSPSRRLRFGDPQRAGQSAARCRRQAGAELGRDVDTYFDDTVVALSFSGGGTRAAAFSFGVLTGFDETRVPTAARSVSLLDRVDFVTGVSGGSVLAAYYGLKKRKALADFKQRFLLRNAEEGLQTELSLMNIARGLQGGINDTQFPQWLDDNLFDHATFKSLLFERRPRVWINASDIYNRTPFVFAPHRVRRPMQRSIDLSGVACGRGLRRGAGRVRAGGDPKLSRRLSDPAAGLGGASAHAVSAPPLLKLYADALERYHSGDVRYVKLLDGGLVDNYGLAAFTIARLAADTPYGPFEPEEAVKLRRMLFLVVDSGRAPSGAWAQTVEGPSGVNLVTAASDTATESGAVGSYSAFEDTMNRWQDMLIKWRCHLSRPNATSWARRQRGTAGTYASSRASRSISWDRSGRARSMPSRRASSCRRSRSTC